MRIMLAAVILAGCQMQSFDEVDNQGSNSLFSDISDAQYSPQAELNLPSTPYNYANQQVPAAYFTQVNNNDNRTSYDYYNEPASNPITDEGATLGRVLFYDKHLSKNGQVACASCHQQALGFSDDAQLSTGFDGGLTRRHSMGLSNAAYHFNGHYFWDERAATLEEQVLLPIQDSVEMGLSLTELEQNVAAQPYYAELFRHAFGDEQVSSERIGLALAQFVRSITSYDSRYDQGRADSPDARRPFANFTAQENNGKDLFFRGRNGVASCASCHNGEAFNKDDRGPMNNGLDLVSSDDLGVYESSLRRGDIGRFKVPSLKNIALTAPYMHDGRFDTLAEVIEFYAQGIQNRGNLDNAFVVNGTARSYGFSASEQADLVAFLMTLTDESSNSDVRWSDPFVQ